MSEEIFRKKSLEKIKSPETLDDYIHVSNPGIWLLLVSIIVLLVGACIWGVLGRIDSTVPSVVHIDSDTAVCYVAVEDISAVREGMTVKFDDYQAVIAEIGSKESDGYVCILQVDGTVPSGIYDGNIVIKSIKPLSFVLN